jgi:hypothetical protein
VDWLEQIVEALSRHEQPATYGAVAGLVGRPPKSLMVGRPRDPKHSWIVERRTGRPTGYAPEELHPALPRSLETKGLITAPEDLEDWLRHHEVGPPTIQPPAADWLTTVTGSMKEEPAFDEVLALGRAFRAEGAPRGEAGP